MPEPVEEHICLTIGAGIEQSIRILISVFPYLIGKRLSSNKASNTMEVCNSGIQPQTSVISAHR